MTVSTIDASIVNALQGRGKLPNILISHTSHASSVISTPYTTIFQHCVNANAVLDLMLTSLKQYDIRTLSRAEYTQVAKHVERVYEYAMDVSKKSGSELTERQKKQITSKAQALKLGGKIAPETLIDTEFGSFVRANHLHHRFSTLQIQLSASQDGIPLIPYVDQHNAMRKIPWNQLRKFNRAEGGYRYETPEGTVLFEVNKKFELLSTTTLNYRGFNQYDALHSNHLLPVTQRERTPGDAEYCLDIVVSTSKAQGNGVGGYSQQHAYFDLFDPRFKYSAGKYPNPYIGDLDTLQQVCATSIKQGSIHSPDEYSSMSNSQTNTTKTRVVLSEAQFTALKNRFLRDKQNPHLDFSVLRRNCSAYVCSVLKEELNIHVNADIPIGKYVYYYMPDSARAPFKFIRKNIYNNLPYPLQIAISLVCKPFYYLYCLGVGVFAKTLSMVNHKNFKDFDITWKDILLNMVVVKHPTRLRHNLRAVFPSGYHDISARG